MRLPLGQPILTNLDPQNQTLFQLLRAFSLSGFHGYVLQHKDDSSAVVLVKDGNPIRAVVRRKGKETLLGPSAAREIASKRECDSCEIVKLSERALKIAHIICMGNSVADGLEPNSKDVSFFYNESRSKKLNSLIQCYNDHEEYYIWIEEGRLVEKPNTEEFKAFRAKGGVLVNLYTYFNDQVAPQPLTLDLFISPHWFRGFLVRQLKRNFPKNIESLIEELETSEVELKDHQHWFKRVGEFLEMFVCTSKKARAFTDKIQALLEETEEYRLLA